MTEAHKAGYKLVFVRSFMRWRENGVCTDAAAGDHLAVYEEPADGFRQLKRVEFYDDGGRLEADLITARVASDSKRPPETLLVVERHYSGTGNFTDSEMYRLRRGSEPQSVQIRSLASLIGSRLHDGQGIVGP